MSDALVNGVAGACGGIIAQILTYPLQAVNTRQQVRRRLLSPADSAAESCASAGPSSEAAASAGGHTAYREREALGAGPSSRGGERRDLERPKAESTSSAGMADTAREMWEIVHTEGLGALYRGLKPSLVGTACSQGVYYYFYQLFRDKAVLVAQKRKAKGQGSGQVGMVESLVVAAMAGCVNVLLTNPIWVIVTRMQTQSSAASARVAAAEHQQQAQLASTLHSASWQEKHSALAPRPMGALATTWELFEEAGILGFWKGVLPTLIMVSNPALQFTIYETLLGRLTENRPKAKGGATSASAWEIFLIGALAKLGATVVTYPLLVVKSRLQARSSDPSSKYSGTLNALVRIVVEEGPLGLYKGMSTKIVQSVFAASVLFLTKEELVKLARWMVERRERLLLHASSASALRPTQ